jgi:NAD(P)-dependent dehydrogenase (short-subunit alcohol dehydrogenase family)
MKRLNGKVALVTGGTTGIGLAAARRFAAEGARVLVTGTNPERLAEARKQILGGEALVSDAGSREDIEKIARHFRDQQLRLDILFLNAGIAKLGPIAEMDEKALDETFRINFKGPWLAIQILAPLMGRGGTIIATTSVNDRIGMPGTSAYGPSKAALRSLVQVAAVELAPRGIRVNAVCPGPIATPLRGKTGLAADVTQKFETMLADSTAMKRIGGAEEVAGCVVFLASDEASYVTGEELVVDGGFLATF